MELNDLFLKTPKDLWNTDLDAFVEEWDADLERYYNQAKQSKKIVKKGGALKVPKVKKQKKLDSDDMDEDSVDDNLSDDYVEKGTL